MTYSRRDGQWEIKWERVQLNTRDWLCACSIPSDFRLVNRCQAVDYLWSMERRMNSSCFLESVTTIEDEMPPFRSSFPRDVWNFSSFSRLCRRLTALKTNPVRWSVAKLSKTFRRVRVQRTRDWWRSTASRSTRRISLWEQWLKLHQRFLIRILVHPFGWFRCSNQYFHLINVSQDSTMDGRLEGRERENQSDLRLFSLFNESNEEGSRCLRANKNTVERETSVAYRQVSWANKSFQRGKIGRGERREKHRSASSSTRRIQGRGQIDWNR